VNRRLGEECAEAVGSMVRLAPSAPLLQSEPPSKPAAQKQRRSDKFSGRRTYLRGRVDDALAVISAQSKSDDARRGAMKRANHAIGAVQAFNNSLRPSDGQPPLHSLHVQPNSLLMGGYRQERVNALPVDAFKNKARETLIPEPVQRERFASDTMEDPEIKSGRTWRGPHPNILSRFDLFEGLSLGLIQEFQSSLERIALRPGSVLISESHEIGSEDGLILVEHGLVEIEMGNIQVSTVSSGCAFGEAAAFGFLKRHLYSARVSEKDENICTIWLLKVEHLNAALSHYPQERAILETNAHKALLSFFRMCVLRKQLKVPCFDSSPLQVRVRLMQILRIRLVTPGQDIVRQGQPWHCGVLVLHGTVSERSADGTEINQLGPATWSGGSLLLMLEACAECPVTLRSETHAIIGALDCKELAGLMENFPEVRSELEDLALAFSDELYRLAPRSVLAGLDCFADDSTSFIQNLEETLVRRRYKTGDHILHYGSECENMRVIGFGRAELMLDPALGGEEETRRREAIVGTSFGELAAIGVGSRRRKDAAKALTVCEVFELSRKHLQNGLQLFPREGEWFREMAKLHVADQSVVRHALQDLPFFVGADAKFFDMLCERLVAKVFFLGSIIMNQGDKGDHLILLLRGTVDIIIDGEILSSGSAPNIYGEAGALQGAQRSATIKSTVTCDTHLLSREHLLEVLDFFPVEKAKFEHLASCRQSVQSEISIPLVGGKGADTDAKWEAWYRFWEGCDQELLAQLSIGLERRFFSIGQLIMKEGEFGDCAFTLQIGTARVTAKGQTVGELGPGNLFGEMAILSEKGTRSATVTATTTCVVLELSRTRLLAALDQFPEQRQRFEELARSRGEVLAFFGLGKNDEEVDSMEHAKGGRHHKENYRSDSPINLLRTPSEMQERNPFRTTIARSKTMEDAAEELMEARQKLKEYVDKRRYKTALAPVRREIAMIRAGAITQQVQPRQGYVNHFIGRVLGYEPDELYDLGAFAPPPLERPLPLYEHSPRSPRLPMLPAVATPTLATTSKGPLPNGLHRGQIVDNNAQNHAIQLEDDGFAELDCQLKSASTSDRELVLPALPATPRRLPEAPFPLQASQLSSPRWERENMTALQFRKSLHVYNQIAE